MLKPLDSSHQPDKTIDVKKVFHIDSHLSCPAFSSAHEHTPVIDQRYCFDAQTTNAILAGFAYNQRVMVQGHHGTGKSTHIEQVAARLNWPCVRVNLDSHISRIDLIGKDGIILKDGQQVTEFQPGILTWALQRPIALVFDEYDAGRADVMFVIQRILESDGKLTLLDQNQVIEPHASFRLFATTNTIGLGDSSGLYHGTQQINQGQMDRWHIVTTLNYLQPEQEMNILIAKAPHYCDDKGRQLLRSIIAMAHMTRQGFQAGDISTVMSPRTLLTWLRNIDIFKNRELAFQLSFLNRCDESERPLIAEYYQRCFNVDLFPQEQSLSQSDQNPKLKKTKATA